MLSRGACTVALSAVDWAVVIRSPSDSTSPVALVRSSEPPEPLLWSHLPTVEQYQDAKGLISLSILVRVFITFTLTLPVPLLSIRLILSRNDVQIAF